MIADAIRQAQQIHRAVIEQTYDGKCTVKVQQKVKKENGATGFSEVTAFENKPCKLIYKSAPAAGESDPAAGAAQVTKLLIAPELYIPMGSKITVEQNGVTRDYCRSSLTVVYASHQEITLELFKRYA